MVAIIDYGVGNLFSLKSSFAAIGQEAVVTRNAQVIAQSDRLILPGVGAFGDARRKLKESGTEDAIFRAVRENKPLLGICLGMQLLFDRSYEYGKHEGLGLIKGAVRPLRDILPPALAVPHIGWNALSFPAGKERSPLFRYTDEGDCVYFVHSYYGADCDEALIAATEYGVPVTAAVQSGNVFGTQFHPEKSGNVGLSILKAFCEVTV